MTDPFRFASCWVGLTLVSCLGCATRTSGETGRKDEPSSGLSSAALSNAALITTAPMNTVPSSTAMTNTAKTTPSIHSFSVNTLSGEPTTLSSYEGKVLLIVNTASECGFTPQYKGLEALHEKYSGQGFAVLGFPSNDFGGQEPGSADEIAAFCSNTYGVTFPLFQKVKVKGADVEPLYATLSETLGPPKWNFHKYLIDRSGHPVQSWPSAVEPLSAELVQAVERELGRR